MDQSSIESKESTTDDKPSSDNLENKESVAPEETTQDKVSRDDEAPQKISPDETIQDKASPDETSKDTSKTQESSTKPDATQSELLSDAELKNRYKETFDFHEAYNLSKQDLEQFLQYTCRRFVLGENESMAKLMDMSKEGKSDYEIYSVMRDMQREHTDLDAEPQKEDKLRSIEKEKYSKTIRTKMRNLRDSFKGRVDSSFIKKVLDIGTEKLEFLDALFDELRLKSNDGTVYGINVEDGFCHYDAESFKNNPNDTRFQFYDGKKIPFGDSEFDLITMYSVIHHIPTPDFKELAHEIARVCNGLLFIKDVDMSQRVENIFFRVQHYVYEGILIPGDTSYLNTEVTIKGTLGMLEDAGFRVLMKRKVPNFNGTYFAVLQKNGTNVPTPPRRYGRSYRGGGRGGRPRGGYQRDPYYSNPRGGSSHYGYHGAYNPGGYYHRDPYYSQRGGAPPMGYDGGENMDGPPPPSHAEHSQSHSGGSESRENEQPHQSSSNDSNQAHSSYHDQYSGYYHGRGDHYGGGAYGSYYSGGGGYYGGGYNQYSGYRGSGRGGHYGHSDRRPRGGGR